ncbi:Phage P22-like portal protein [uncultured Caudovirales phage]|uniref:Phage P22-like portal protein n=1 Tax=uncultured Caudovirales phage TaxID=2100421 RepID=A0A6J7WGA0_9CAUD|nr:Phage P22-like portal protein [uncultured Caudovirales phage]
MAVYDSGNGGIYSTEYGDDYESGIIEEAKEFLRFCSDNDSNNRVEALDDLKFAGGDQWPVEIQNSRLLESRPYLTINKIDAYCRQITNQQRQQRPRMKAHGMNDQSDEKVAEIITGICRHIENQSDADAAYDNAFDFAVRMGWGYWRITHDYPTPESFDQEIYIKRIENPFMVYFDPNSNEPDGSDAEKCLITEVVSKEAFRKMYPGADDGGGFTPRGTGDSQSEWITKEDIRIAEYFYTERKRMKLLLLSDGTTCYEDEKPSEVMMQDAGIYVVSKRETIKKQIKWCKLTGMQILEQRDWVGKHIPVVPVYGQQLIVDSKKKKFGLTRMAKDPQRMYNFWSTALTESVALAPKAKFLLAEGQDEGHEMEWNTANIKSMPVLRYKQTDSEGRPAPVPTRIQPEPPPTGMVTALEGLNADLKAVVGIYDPAQLPNGNQSGKAINGMQQQTDMTNFHYYDNLTRSIRQTGRIILDLIPHIYDKERVLRIIGADGKGELVTLNQRAMDEQGVEKVLNDVTVGQYDVVMETGPGYASKRQEAVDSMVQMLQVDPALMQQAGDLVFRNMDFPGADIIADRLAAANPLAQIDEKSDIPPQVQMQLAQSQQTIQQLQQELQAMQMDMKYRASLEEQKQKAETERKAMDVEVRREDTRMRTDTQAHDTVIKTQTQLEVEQMKAQLALIMAQMDMKSERAALDEAIERGI